MLSRILTSPSFIYVILRYSTYALAFINTLLLAKFLGSYHYGIYSFILLVFSYMSYSNLGINDSLNTEYAKYKHKRISKYIWDSSWTINMVITILGSLIFYLVYCWNNDIFIEYHFKQYAFVLILTCAIINLQKIYITYYRLYGKLLKINIQQILPNITVFILAIFLNYNISINIIVWTLFITNLLSLLIFRIGVPHKPKILFRISLIKVLILRGISLLMYNFSFSLFILLASSIVSLYYSVSEFGCFSLSNSIANGVIMAGGAFLFIFYPKILNSFSRSNEECFTMIKKIKSIYVVSIDIICILTIPIVYGISFIYPQYALSLVRIYTILILGKCINNATTGYSAYLIASKKELLLTLYALIAVSIEWGIIRFFLSMGYGMEYIALAVALGSLVYTVLIVITGLRKLSGYIDFRECLSEILGKGKWLVLAILYIYSFYLTNIYYLSITLIGYYILNHHNINVAIKNGLEIIKNKNALNF